MINLSEYSKNVFSQNGEDGIIEKIFEIIPPTGPARWCVEFGAWDGEYLSNCCNLIRSRDWSGVFIEAGKSKFLQLKENYKNSPSVICINAFVEFNGENTLDNILKKTDIPECFDLLSVDIDGNDYHVWEKTVRYRPKVVVIEFNPTIPSDIEFIQEPDSRINQGNSILSLAKLAEKKKYRLLACTRTNGIFIDEEYISLFAAGEEYEKNLKDILPKIEAPRVFQLYDGTLRLSGKIVMNWTGIEIREDQLQFIPKFLRHFDDDRSNFVRRMALRLYLICFKKHYARYFIDKILGKSRGSENITK
jgi:hypothetical protein